MKIIISVEESQWKHEERPQGQDLRLSDAYGLRKCREIGVIQLQITYVKRDGNGQDEKKSLQE